MNRFAQGALAAAFIFGLAACSQDPTGSRAINANASLEGAFATPLYGFNNLHSSFDGGDSLEVWGPEGRGHHGPPGPGFGGRGHERELGGPEHGMEGALMGGGLGGLFMGDGFGPGFGHGRLGDDGFSSSTCTFDAASGRVVCAAIINHGVTVNRSVAFATASGTVQSAFDSVTTNSINVRVSAAGTVTRRDSAVTTIQNASERTVSGLAAGSTQRTVNSTSAGTESTAGTNSKGAFTAVRSMGDTTTAVVIPVATTAAPHPYPSSGTIIRSMSATVTYAGTAPVTSTRREVITYDGTASAKIVVVKDGVTHTCTVALPHGRPSCQ